MIFDEIYEKIEGFLQNKQALLFCGAGISIDPPSSLPGWNTLRNYTLEAIAAREPSLCFHLNDLTTLTLQSSPTRRGLIPEIVASVISQRCSGYFDSFKSLEEGLPNRNHMLIAELAAKGSLKYIITTNFDLFIEKALAEKGVAFRVLRSEDDYKTFTITEEDPTVCLLKIHGCISAPGTITATVEQEALGLSANKLLALELLLPQFFFIFWGYSGEDLKIDLNYLGQVKYKDQAKGFAWNLFENETFKETPNPYVIRLTDMYNDKSIIRHSLLPSTFESFLGKQTGQRPDANEVAISSARNEEHLRNFLSGWAREHVGVIDACVIFARLLNYAGLYKHELVCYERMAEHCNVSSDELQKAESELYIGQVKHKLKQETDALLAFENALKCFQQHRNISGIKNTLFALGDYYADKEQFDNAIEYYTQLQGLIAGEYNSLSLGEVLLKVGNVKMSQAKVEEAIKSFRDAENVFSRLGAKVRLIETKLKIGKYHLGYGEWQEALTYLEEGRQIAIDLGHKSLLLDVIIELLFAQGMLSKYKEAGDSISEATLLADELENHHAQASIHRSLGVFLNDQKRKEDALTELTKAEEISTKHQLQILRGNILYTKSCILQDLDRIDEALSLFEQTHDQMNRIGDGNGAGVAARCIAVIYANNFQNYERAIYYLQVALAAFRSRELEQYTIEILESMAGCKAFYERPLKQFDELVPEELRQPGILRQAYYYLYGEKETKLPDEQLVKTCMRWAEEFGIVKSVFLISLAVKKIALAKLEQDKVDFLPQLLAAESISRELSDIQSVARLLNDQAIIHKKCGRLDDALKLLQEAVEISRKLKDNKELLTGLHNLSLLYDVLKNENQSYLCLLEALDLSLVIGDVASQIKAVRFLAFYLKTCRRFDEALDLLNHLESLATKEGDLSALLFTYQSRGKIFYEQGRYAASVESRKKTLQLVEAQSERGTAASISLLIANIYDKKLGDAVPASVYYEKAEGYFNAVGDIKNAREMQERRLKLQLQTDNREQVIIKLSLWDNLVSQLGSESIVRSVLTVAAGYIPLQHIFSDQLEYCKAMESEFGITRALIEIYLCVSDYMRARMFYPEAMKYINFAEALFELAPASHPLRAKVLLYRSKTFLEQGAFPLAHDTVDSGLFIAESNEQDELIFHLLLTKGDIFARSGSDGNAIAVYSKAEEYLPGLNNIEATKQTTSALYKLYSKTQDLEKMEKYKDKMLELEKVPG